MLPSLFDVEQRSRYVSTGVQCELAALGIDQAPPDCGAHVELVRSGGRFICWRAHINLAGKRTAIEVGTKRAAEEAAAQRICAYVEALNARAA